VRGFCDSTRSCTGRADEDESRMRARDAWLESTARAARACAGAFGRRTSASRTVPSGSCKSVSASCALDAAWSTHPNFRITNREGADFVGETIAGPPGGEVAAAKRKAALRKGLGKDDGVTSQPQTEIISPLRRWTETR
jgi:hypothetical protein